MLHVIDRRTALASLSATVAAAPLAGVAPLRPGYRLAPFSAEITVPLGHPLMGGGVSAAKKIDDPLFAHGFVFYGDTEPVVVCVLDWCEVRNDAYAHWRAELARAAGTRPGRVLLTSVHQHDAPIADLYAERLLREAKAPASICDLDFHEKTVQRVARAVRTAALAPRRITHVGTGQARVEQIASNRRYTDAQGRVVFGRTSATRDEHARKQPEGTIDPFVKVLAFRDGERDVAALYCYATHPMSYYGQGGVSADFVGLARSLLQKDRPGVLQIYASGASGNVTAGKFNDGAAANRAVLANRLYKGMCAARDAIRWHTIKPAFRTVAYGLAPRRGPGFEIAELRERIKNDKRPFGRCLAALGLSWRKRCDDGIQLDMPVLDLGAARLLVLPGEAYVEYQLLAQKIAPDSFVMALGYGECGPGYVPTAQAEKERDSNLRDWCWVAPGAEAVLTKVIRQAAS